MYIIVIWLRFLRSLVRGNLQFFLQRCSIFLQNKSSSTVLHWIQGREALFLLI